MNVCVCICTLVICHANQLLSAQHYIVVCGLSGSTIFSTLSHKWHDLWGKRLLNKKCVF